jgi:hypothetical protein
MNERQRTDDGHLAPAPAYRAPSHGGDGMDESRRAVVAA